MTVFSLPRLPVFFRSDPAQRPRRAVPDPTDRRLRQDYVERLIAADCCMSECGAGALMALFPQDF